LKEPFVHLHVHTQYSWDGACTCQEIPEQTKKLGMSSVAITDHGYMHGVIEFYKKCIANGIKPVIGCEFSVAPQTTHPTGNAGHFNMILLAENETGYRNLIKLASSASAKDRFETPSIDHSEFQKFSKGLIGIYSCIDPEMPAAILNGDNTDEINRVLFYKELLGRDNYFLELRPSNDPFLVSANRSIVEMSQKYDIPLVAANNVHYLRPEDAVLHHILVCDRRNITLNEMYRAGFKEDGEYLRSPEEMWAIFGTELPQSLLNTVRIAERCHVDLERGPHSLTNFQLFENETDYQSLCRIAEEGLKKRLKTNEPSEAYSERLHYELSSVDKSGFSGYFCLVADIIDAAHNISVQTGASRRYLAGSLLAWSLGISETDPLKYGLLFELFHNPSGTTPPLVHIEVSERGRECILSYIGRKYGIDRAARMIVFENISREKSVTVAGRAMGMTAHNVDRAISFLNNTLYPDYLYSIPEQVKLDSRLKTLCESDESTNKLLDLAHRIRGVVRLSYEDPSGVVITPDPVSDTLPVWKSGSQRLLTQYKLYDLEMGYIRIPMIYFYGLKELSLIEDTLSAINAKGKNAVDFDQIPLDNRKTFELILSGNTNGVFSDEFYYAIEDLVKRIKPDRFEDLMALIALCGLAPLECGLADKYILCKQSKRPADLIHKSLIAPTAETYGLFLYHEQIVQCIAGITGCSTGEANRIRKSMAKNNPKIITEYRKKFISDSTNNGISSRDAGDLFNFIKMNARHTYPKTRCAEYALQIYRSAWLKANCPDEFMEAYLSRSMFDKALISAS